MFPRNMMSGVRFLSRNFLKNQRNNIKIFSLHQMSMKCCHTNVEHLPNKIKHSIDIKSDLNTMDISSGMIDVNSDTLTEQEQYDINKYSESLESSVLEPCDEDVSHYNTHLPATETLSGYANKSLAIQKLVDLGVHLYHWEDRDDVMDMFINMDYETQLTPYILFFLETVGVTVDNLGPMISKCPFVLQENIDNLKTRIEYLKHKKFEQNEIAGIVGRHPKWLMYKVEVIDERLGWLQSTFHLTGNQVRALCTQLPKLITSNKRNIMEVKFSVQEEMGFESKEAKSILLSHPRLFTQKAATLVKTFNYVHNTMEISHAHILQFPNILTSRLFRLKNRHEYLKSLGRNQYDPLKPNYVSLKGLVEGSDADFCSNIAKTTLETYNLFLKCV